MEIVRTQVDAVEIIELHGRFDEMAGADVQESFLEAAQGARRRVLVDLAGVEYISSSGLRTLLALYRALKQSDGQLKLCALSPFVAEVFEVSNFTAVFDIHATRKEALESFAQ